MEVHDLSCVAFLPGVEGKTVYLVPAEQVLIERKLKAKQTEGLKAGAMWKWPI